MRHMYNRAEKVLVWLGSLDLRGLVPNESFSFGGHSTLTRPTNNKSRGFPSLGYHETLDFVIKTCGVRFEGLGLSSPRDDRFHQELCRAAYWERLWIIQEIVEAHSTQVYFRATSVSDLLVYNHMGRLHLRDGCQKNYGGGLGRYPEV